MNIAEYDPDKTENIPQSQEAEQGLLGILMNDNLLAVPEVQELVKPEDFYNPVHRRIAKLIWMKSGRGQVCNAVEINARFDRDGQLGEIGGTEYVTKLWKDAPDAKAAPEYAKLVADLSIRRMVMETVTKIYDKAMNLEPDLIGQHVLNEFEGGLHLCQGVAPATARFVSLKQAMLTVVHSVETGVPMGVPMGYKDLDKVLGGAGREKLIILGGRPGMGKTCAAMNFARNMARGIPDDDGNMIPGKVGFFSQEMPSTELGERSLAAHDGNNSGPQYLDIAKHDVTDGEIEDMRRKASEGLETLLIDETGGLTVSELMNRARAMKRQLGGLDALFVDYLQLLGRHDLPKGTPRHEAYGMIAQRLKQFAKNELLCPIFLICQVKRECEDRADKRPYESDLKGSSDLEDAADVIIMIYRHEHYLVRDGEPSDTKKAMEWKADRKKWANVVEFVIRKNKGGAKRNLKYRIYLGHDVITEYSNDDDELDAGFEGF